MIVEEVRQGTLTAIERLIMDCAQLQYDHTNIITCITCDVDPRSKHLMLCLRNPEDLSEVARIDISGVAADWLTDLIASKRISLVHVGEDLVVKPEDFGPKVTPRKRQRQG